MHLRRGGDHPVLHPKKHALDMFKDIYVINKKSAGSITTKMKAEVNACQIKSAQESLESHSGTMRTTSSAFRSIGAPRRAGTFSRTTPAALA